MANGVADWVKHLRRAMPGRVHVDTPTLAAHAGDGWMASAMPQAVVMAQSTEDVVKAVSFAAKHQLPVTARGAGRGYVGGCVPMRGGIVLSVAQMNQILELHTGDGVAVVQPGVITGLIAQAARDKGWMYPPDPASLGESSIGGNVATNAGGPRCLKYGVTRHYVLGLQAVLPDGRVLRCGGRTHKNRSGFDLVGLFVGSEGMLGILTEITLRLIPHPATRAGGSAIFPSTQKAAKALNRILDAGLLPCALELADSFTLDAARRHLGPSRVPPGKAHVMIEFDGNLPSVRADLSRAISLLRSCGATHIRRASGQAGCEELWKARREFSYALKATGLTKFNEDITVPRSRIPDLLAFCAKLQRDSGIPIASFGHAGDGNIHTNLMADLTRPGSREAVEQSLDRLFAQVIAWGGAISGEHGIGLAKCRWWEKALNPTSVDLHHLLKKAIDPQGIFNPGKFLG